MNTNETAAKVTALVENGELTKAKNAVNRDETLENEALEMVRHEADLENTRQQTENYRKGWGWV